MGRDSNNAYPPINLTFMKIIIIDHKNLVYNIVCKIDAHVSVLDINDGTMLLDVDNIFNKNQFKDFLNKKLKPKDFRVALINKDDFYCRMPDSNIGNESDIINSYMEVVQIKHQNI